MPVLTLEKYNKGNVRDFERAVRDLAKRHKKRFIDKYRQKIHQLLKELAKETPKDTGAAAGIPTGKPLYSSHPASRLGLAIGNLEGESGWQVHEIEKSDGSVSFTIVNPMWEHYLKYIEFGFANHKNHAKVGFVRETWLKFKENKL